MCAAPFLQWKWCMKFEHKHSVETFVIRSVESDVNTKCEQDLISHFGDQILNIYFSIISHRYTGSALLSAVLWVLCSTTSFCSHVCVASLKDSTCLKAVNLLKLRASRTHGACPSSSKHKLYKQSGKAVVLTLFSAQLTECIHDSLCPHLLYTLSILLDLHPEPGGVETSPTSPSPQLFRLHDLERGLVEDFGM